MTDPVLKPWERRAAQTAKLKPWEKRQSAPITGLDGMTTAQRIAAAKAGTLPQPSAERLAEVDASNAKAMPHENTIAGTLAQFGAGSHSGLAQGLGLPVDAVAGGLNVLGKGEGVENPAPGVSLPIDMAFGGLNLLSKGTGGWSPIENPVGGSQFFRDVMAPLSAGIPEPQSRMERFARRMGQEVGTSVAMLPAAYIAPAARAAPLATAGVELVAALGSGAGAAAANELAPNSALAEIAGSFLGGLPIAVGASRLAGLTGQKSIIQNGIEDQKKRAADAYDTVRADTRVISPESVDDMALGLSARMDSERINPRLHPGAAAVLDAILTDSSAPMRIEDIENLRRLTTQSLPATASPADRRLTGIMTDEITKYLDNFDDPVANSLRDGRDAHRRAMAAGAVRDAEKRAASRAARSGSGGNEINSMRQSLASIVETPRKARSFTAPELAAMEDIVMGTPGQNVARGLSRIAPSSGGLGAMLGIGGVTAVPHVAAPIMALAEGAKIIGERSTRASIAKLLQSLAPDRVVKPREIGIDPVIAALLAGRAMAGAGENGE